MRNFACLGTDYRWSLRSWGVSSTIVAEVALIREHNKQEIKRVGGRVSAVRWKK
jgi:hypothetical protein